MIVLALFGLGLCLGSFVNAWVWRVHKQSKTSSKKVKEQYSILHGRSMCVHCKHELVAKDLVPLFSWLSLRGKCRYCHKKISWQYPLVEFVTALLSIISYLAWTTVWHTEQKVLLGFWLVELVCLVALAVYDLRWYLLPNRMLIVLTSLFGGQLIAQIALGLSLAAMLNLFGGALVGGGLFWLIFQVSGGKWIGGGDVKLGAVLGLLVGTPGLGLLVIFLASVLGVVAALPLLATKKQALKQRLPFGPFLIIATVIVRLFGTDMVHWYMRLAGL
jgi:prepilin signal peptidase PulO-like enzyme (type II secretory pathway)